MRAQSAMHAKRVNSLHPKLFRLSMHYAAAAKSRPMPVVDSYDPEELHWLFGCFYTARVLTGGSDYRFEYCGSCWQSYWGLDPTGKRLSELETSAAMKTRRAEFDTVVAQRRPQYSVGSLVWADGTTVGYDRMTIPFGDHRGNVVMLLVAAQSSDNPATLVRHNILGRPRVEIEDTFWPWMVQSSVQSLSASALAE